MSHKITKTTLFAAVLSVFFLFAMTASGWSDSYYYVYSGLSSGSNNGSGWGNAWRGFGSINWSALASDARSEPVYLYVKRGTTESSRVVVGAGGSSDTNRIIITTHPDDTGSAPVLNAGIYMENRSYITWQNLDIRYTGGNIIEMWYDCDYQIFESCSVGPGGGYSGFRMQYGPDHGIVRNCTLNGQWSSPGDAFHLRNGANNWQIHNNSVTGWNHAAFGLYHDGGTSAQTVNSNRIHSNYVYGNGVNYFRAFAPFARSEGMCSDNRFYNNYIYNTTVRNQIGGDRNFYYYNIIDTVTHPRGYGGIKAEGISLEPQGSGSPGIAMYNKVYNNVIYNTDEPGIHLWLYSGGDPYIQGNEIVNNIVLNCGKNSQFAPFQNIGIEVDNYGNIRNNTFKNNLVYKSGVNAPIYYRGSYLTAADFNSQASNGDVAAGNFQADPLFTDDSNSNFTLQCNSSAMGTGMDLGENFILALDPAMKKINWPGSVTTKQQGSAWNVGAFASFENFAPPSTPKDLRVIDE